MSNILLEFILLNLIEGLIFLLFCVRLDKIKNNRFNTVVSILVIAIISSMYNRVLPVLVSQGMSVVSISILLSFLYDEKLFKVFLNGFMCMFLVMPIVEITYMIAYEFFIGELIISMKPIDRFLTSIPFRIIEVTVAYIKSKGVFNNG